MGERARQGSGVREGRGRGTGRGEGGVRVYVCAAGRAGSRGQEEGDEALGRLLESARAPTAHHHGR